jgi:predicted outer membrane repeat protein
VTSNYFTGTSSITAGVLEFSTGTVLGIVGTIGIWQTGVLDITTPEDMTFTGNVIGDSVINKVVGNTGNLTLAGDNSVFSGAYTQDSGTTTVTSSGRMFSGTNNISNSLLQITTGDGVYYRVNLGDNGILEHFNTTSGATTVSASSITFTGIGALASFGKDAGLSVNANYALANKIENGNANTVEFNTSDVLFGSDDYTGATTYSFNNSNIDIMSNPATSTRTVEFTDFKSSNTALSFAVDFAHNGIGVDLYSDMLSAGSYTGDGLLLGNILIYGDQDHGLNGTYNTQVLEGGIYFQSSTMAIATSVYEYLAAVDGSQTGIDLSVVKEADADSLNAMNVYYGNRGFMFSFFAGFPEVYNVGASLDAMSTGTFTIQGYDIGGDATLSVISGISTMSVRSSLFNMVNATNLEINDLTIEDAYIAGDGSVLRIANAASIAELSNLIIQNNESTGNGGAIYNDNGQITINKLQFSGNTAGVEGGAIYNAAAGVITLTSDNGDILFENNTANGVSNDIYNSGTLNINGSLNDVVINGGISGTGDIEKSNSGRLLINGDSSGFTGTMNQTGGMVLVSTAYFGGMNTVTGGTTMFVNGGTITSAIELGTGGTIEINKSEDWTLGANEITGYSGGYGTTNKTNSGTLFLTADNSGFLGTFNIVGGAVSPVNDVSLTFGKFVVESGGRYNTQSGTAGQITAVSDAIFSGTVEMDADLALALADNIIASGNIEINAGSSLNLDMFNIPASKQMRILLMQAGGTLNGTFTNVSQKSKLSLALPGGYHYGLEYDYAGSFSGIPSVYLIVMKGMNLTDIPNLTHNQREAAVSLDEISNGGSYINDMPLLIDAIDALPDNDAKKDALDQLHGTFLANAIMQAGERSGINELYGRLKERICAESEEEAKLPISIWGQGYVHGNRYEHDENSVGDFSNLGYGGQIGADLFTWEHSLLGIYIGYGQNELKQRYDEGTMSDMGAGLYGAYFGEKIDIKANAMYGKQSFKTTRDVRFYGTKPKAEFDTYAVKGDAEAAYKIEVGEKLLLKPFIGGQFAWVHNDEFEETGGGAANLRVLAGDYTKLIGLLGVGIGDEISRLNWYAKVNVGYQALGAKNTVDSVFVNSFENRKMEIWGADRDEL